MRYTNPNETISFRGLIFNSLKVLKNQSLNTFLLFFALSISGFAQTIKTVGAVGSDYTSLTSAFNDVNNGVLTGDLEFQITSSITEPTGLRGASLIANGEVGWVNISTTGTDYKPGDLIIFSAPQNSGTIAEGVIT